MKGINKKFTKRDSEVVAEKFLEYCEKYPEVEITKEEYEMIIFSGFNIYSHYSVGDMFYFNGCKLRIVEETSNEL